MITTRPLVTRPHLHRFSMAAFALLNACGSEPDDACVLQPGVACVVAGDGSSGLGDDGELATAVSLYLPMDVKQTENAGLVIADFNNHRVVAIRNGVIDVLTGEGLGIPGGPVEGPASEAGMTHPTGVTELPSGELLVAIWHSYRVIRLDRDQKRVEFVTGTPAQQGLGQRGHRNAGSANLGALAESHARATVEPRHKVPLPP